MEELLRVAVIVSPKLASGQAMNAACIVSGGLMCGAFLEPIPGADGVLHAAIKWNLVVLTAKSDGFLYKVTQSAKDAGVRAVVFSNEGQELSNSFESYRQEMRASDAENLKLIAVALCGPDSAVRTLSKPCSLFR